VSEKGFAKPYAQGIDFPSLMSWQYADRESLLCWTKPLVGKNYTYPEQTPPWDVVTASTCGRRGWGFVVMPDLRLCSFARSILHRKRRTLLRSALPAIIEACRGNVGMSERLLPISSGLMRRTTDAFSSIATSVYVFMSHGILS
jgi:hypothetical protein